MTLPSIKQHYVALRALSGQDKPIPSHALVQQMKRVSEEEFGNPLVYVYSPAPLSVLFDEMSSVGDMSEDDEGLAITAQGRRELATAVPLIHALETAKGLDSA
jgi:hypothetical protein